MRAIRKAPVGASLTEVAAIAGISVARVCQVSAKLEADGLVFREVSPGPKGRPKTCLVPKDEMWRGIGLPIMSDLQQRVYDAIEDIGPLATPTQIGALAECSPQLACWAINAIVAKGLMTRSGRGRGRRLIILDDED